MIGYLDKDGRPLVLTMPKINGYVKSFKVEDKNNQFMSFRIDDEKLFKKYEAIWTMTEDFKKIQLNTLPVYEDKYIKAK